MIELNRKRMERDLYHMESYEKCTLFLPFLAFYQQKVVSRSPPLGLFHHFRQFFILDKIPIYDFPSGKFLRDSQVSVMIQLTEIRRDIPLRARFGFLCGTVYGAQANFSFFEGKTTSGFDCLPLWQTWGSGVQQRTKRESPVLEDILPKLLSRKDFTDELRDRLNTATKYILKNYHPKSLVLLRPDGIFPMIDTEEVPHDST